MTPQRNLARAAWLRRVKSRVHYWLPATIAFRRGLRDRMRVSTIVHARAGGVVQRGPFAGMRTGAFLPDTSSKVLGTYEQELHGALEELLGSTPARIVNVGCSDGYYAVGCKLRSPGSDVHGFDLSEQMRELTTATADLNNVEVAVGGELGHRRLEELLSVKASLVICDCEGCEFGLLDPSVVPSLSRASLLVELHEEVGSVEEFLDRFRASHEITLIESVGRTPPEAAELHGLSDDDRSLAVFERPTRMIWGVFLPTRK